MARSGQTINLDDLDGTPENEDNPNVVDPVSDPSVAKAGKGSELAVVESQGLDAEPSAYVGGPAYQFNQKVEFDSEDLNILRISLAQGLSDAVQQGLAKPGQWVASGYDPNDKVVLVPFGYGKTRSYHDKEGTLQCSSPDAVKGYGNPGIACKQCPNAQWTVSPDGKRAAPVCQLIYKYMVISTTHDAIAEISFKSTQIPAAKFINNMIQSKGLGGFGIELSSKSEKNARGAIYHIPVPTLAQNIDNKYFEQAQEMMTLA